MKRFIIGMIAGILMSGGVVSAMGTGTLIEVFYNVSGIAMDGNALDMEQKPFIHEGRTYVYLGDVATAFGRELEWDGETGGIEIVMPKEEHGSIDKESKIEQYENVVSDIASKLESDWPSDINAFLEGERKSSQLGMEYVYFADENGRMYYSTNIQLPDGYDPRERPWYNGAAENGVYVSKPYADILSGGELITVSKSVYSNGEIVGVIGADFKL